MFFMAHLVHMLSFRVVIYFFCHLFVVWTFSERFYKVWLDKEVLRKQRGAAGQPF